MRSIVLLAAFVLASCGGDGSANTQAVTEEDTADSVTAGNDATAIDAATGEVAGMAADVNYTLNEAEFDELAENGAAANAASNSAD